MKISIYVTVILLLCVFAAQSQTGNANRLYIIPQAGLLNGDQYVSGQVTLVGGIERNGWGFGIGSGVDYYKVRTVPVFIDLRRSFTINKWPLFAYANVGWNIAAPLSTQLRTSGGWWYQADNKYNSGWLGEAGFGYSFLNKQKKDFQLGLGFSTKTLEETYTETVYRDFPPYGSTQEQRRLNYTFNRVILKIGYRL